MMSANKIIENLSNNPNIPDYIKPSIIMESPNEQIVINEGNIGIELDLFSIMPEGKIFINWFPKMNYYFRGTHKSTRPLPLEAFSNKSVFISGKLFGMLFPLSVSNKSIPGATTFCITIEGIIKIDKNYYDYSPSANDVNFSLTNYNHFVGIDCKIIKDSSVTIIKHYYAFENDKYLISINLLNNHNELCNKLEQSGGFVVLAGGNIKKISGPISYKESLDELYNFSLFISFINGFSISPVFLNGIYDGEIIWEDHISILENDNYKSQVPSWTPLFYNTSFNDMWVRFSSLCLSKENKHFLELIIRWYLMLLRSSVENAIVISQIALELLYNWYIVEEKKLIIGKDCIKIEASNKIRLLLGQIGIDYSIPVHYTELIEYVKSNSEIKDAIDALTSIRNILIHSQGDKRKNYAEIKKKIKNQVIDLSIHFIELTLLKILDYNGKYYNRITNSKNSEEITPWSIDKSKG